MEYALTDDAKTMVYMLSKAKMEISNTKSFIEFQKRKIREIKQDLAGALTPSWYKGPCFVKITYEINDYGYDEKGNIDVISGPKWIEKETPVLYLDGFEAAGETDDLRIVPNVYWTTSDENSGTYDCVGGKYDLFEKNEAIIIKGITVLRNA